MKIFLLILGGAFVLFIVYSFFMARKMRKSPAVADSDKIKNLSDASFAKEIKTGITLVDFWAPWCMPCKMMVPMLNELAERTDLGATICKLNIDENQKSSAKYGVRGIPTSILFKNGKEVKRFVGVKPADYFAKQIRAIK